MTNPVESKTIADVRRPPALRCPAPKAPPAKASGAQFAFHPVISPHTFLQPEQLQYSVPEAGDITGQLIADRFFVIECFDGGGLASIYLAEDRQNNNRIVVLKTSLANKSARKSLAAEICTMRQLGREAVNIVDCLAVGTNFLVLEYVEERSLLRFISKREEPLTEDYALAALQIIREVLVGLESLDERRLVSADISPGNILVTDDVSEIINNGAKVTLIDIGLGARVRQANSPKRIFGKPSYVSSEQARGERNLDGRADVYSAGMVLYCMLTGLRPMAGMEDLDILHQRGWENERFGRPFEPESELAAIPEQHDLKRRVYDLMLRMTGKTSDVIGDGPERFGSAFEARLVVDGILDNFRAVRQKTA
jgi:serine/threonine protein kinase